MPRGEARGRKFTFVLSDDERAQLEALARADHRTSSDWIRVVIATTYAERFGELKRKRIKR